MPRAKFLSMPLPLTQVGAQPPFFLPFFHSPTSALVWFRGVGPCSRVFSPAPPLAPHVSFIVLGALGYIYENGKSEAPHMIATSFPPLAFQLTK